MDEEKAKAEKMAAAKKKVITLQLANCLLPSMVSAYLSSSVAV
jgi:hypothetical protein